MSPAVKTGLLAPAGLIVGPALLVATTELGLTLPYLTCGSPVHPPALIAFACALLALGSGWVSWRASRPGIPPRGELSVYPRSFGFVGLVAAGVSLVFAYALTLQAVSAVVLTGCER